MGGGGEGREAFRFQVIMRVKLSVYIKALCCGNIGRQCALTSKQMTYKCHNLSLRLLEWGPGCHIVVFAHVLAAAPKY